MALKVFKKLCCSGRRSRGRLHRPKATPLPVGKVKSRESLQVALENSEQLLASLHRRSGLQ